MTSTTIERRDEVTLRLFIPWHELEAWAKERAFTKIAVDENGVATRRLIEERGDMKAVASTVRVEQMRGGSPSYSVSKWEVWVEVTVPLGRP